MNDYAFNRAIFNPLKFRFADKVNHVKLMTHPARNSLLLGQKDVGVVYILFDHPTSLPIAGMCTTWTNICTVPLESEIFGTRGGTSRNRLFRTAQTCSVSQWDHRERLRFDQVIREYFSKPDASLNYFFVFDDPFREQSHLTQRLIVQNFVEIKK